MRSRLQQDSFEEAWPTLLDLSASNLAHIQRIGRRLLGVEAVQVVEAGDEERSGYGQDAAAGNPFIEHVLSSEGLFVVEDAARDPRFAHARIVKRPPHVRFAAGVRLRGRDGRTLGALCVMDARPQALDEEGATALGDLAATASNDLEMRRVCAELRAVHDELHESQRMLYTLMSNLPGMVYRCRNDRAWTMEFVSEGSTALTGYGPEVLVGERMVTYGQLIHVEDRERVWQAVQEAVADGVPFRLTYRLWTADGAEKWVWEQGRGVYGPAGELLFIEGFVEDVTRRKRYQEELVEARRQAETMNQLKSSLLTNFSHEIRTPLAGILGFADLLAGEVGGEQRDFAHQIRMSGQRLLDTLNSVLDLSLLESGAAELHRERCDVAGEVRKAVQALRPLAQEKGLALRTAFPSVPARAHLDPAALGRILNNLIGNAIKFTDEGEVRVAVQALPHQVAIVVKDTGIGIDASFQEHLFQAFKQESTGLARLHEGIGLGLSIVKHLVARMEGAVTVESEKGQGATFTVTFPRAEASQGAHRAPERVPIRSEKPTDRSAKQVRVLVVEDDATMRRLLGEMLAALPEVAAVETASGGEEALRLARQQTFDVVLLDIHLGQRQTGEALLGALRATPAYGDVPAVAMTAYALPGDRERFLAAGFDAYLGKPFTQEMLSAVLQRVSHPGGAPVKE